MKYDFLYIKGSSQEEGAYEAIQKMDRETEFKIAVAEGSRTNVAAKIEQLELERDEYEDEIEDMILEGRFEQDGHADSINLSMNLIPSIDIKNAFCAVIVGHTTIDGTSRRFRVGIQRLGDLMRDIPEATNFTVFLGEGNYTTHSVDIFLYSEDGAPVATSVSRHLKKLTIEELKKLQ